MKPTISTNPPSDDMQQLKTKLISLFEKYQASRRNLITKLFRNQALSQAKCRIAHDTINRILTFEGNHAELIALLISKQTDNGVASFVHDKLHYNVYEKRESQHKNFFGQPRKIVRRGESSNKSQLAEVFHQAIALVKQQAATAGLEQSFSVATYNR